jgi:hypothetical protein
VENSISMKVVKIHMYEDDGCMDIDLIFKYLDKKIKVTKCKYQFKEAGREGIRLEGGSSPSSLDRRKMGVFILQRFFIFLFFYFLFLF